MLGAKLPSLIFMFLCLCSEGLSISSEDVNRLFKDKLDIINPRIIPVRNQSKPIEVQFKVHLNAISDFDELLQKITTTMWLEVQWRDELIAWNESEYGGVNKIFPHPDDLWRPSLAVAHKFEDLKPIGTEFVVQVVRSDGLVTWFPGAILQTFCKVNIELYPFDVQTCNLEFFNWGTVAGELLLTTHNEGLVRDSYHENGEWKIMNISVENTFRTFSNGELVKPYSIISITIGRRSSIIALTVILPVVLLSFLNIGVFIIPAESGEKLSFGVTILLSLAVFLSYINSMMPQTSESISYLSLYISTQLIISSLAVFMSCIILSLYHRHEGTLTKIQRYWLCVPKLYEENGKDAVFQIISRRFDHICFWIFGSMTAVVLCLFLLAINGMFLSN